MRTYSITAGGKKHRSRRGPGEGLFGESRDPATVLAPSSEDVLRIPRQEEGGGTTMNDQDDDNDDDGDQAKSRRRKQRLVLRRRRGRGSLVTTRGGIVVLGLVSLALSCLATGRLRAQKARQALQRRERAERLFQERQERQRQSKAQREQGQLPLVLPTAHLAPEGQSAKLAGQAKFLPQADESDVNRQLAHLPTLPYERNRLLNEVFRQHRGTSQVSAVLQVLLQHLNHDVQNNVDGGMRWIQPYLLPPLPGQPSGKDQLRDGRLGRESFLRGKSKTNKFDRPQEFFRIRRSKQRLKWQDEWDALSTQEQHRGPAVDYTNASKYTYPPIASHPPTVQSYPVFRPLAQIMSAWKQDEDFEGVIHESLMHFNYSNPAEVEMAKRYREAKIPFKFYDVPEVSAATHKWTDEYVDANYRGANKVPRPQGTAQESANNFFAFFYAEKWDVDTMGLPPTRNTDWSFAQWAAHARYADAVRLPPHQPHFYWQSGIPATERHEPRDRWTFVSRDLPSFSSPIETFFVWHPDQQKGIQCRFGERGVVAATHYDSGRNSVAMITGAKRYILSPPRACSELGVFTSSDSAIFRHSLLNFAHIPHAADASNDMSPEERQWLKRAGTAEAVETVVKAGEVLYIPSHWFHYIVSLQKSAQCNVRSGVDVEGTDVFGGKRTVLECKDRTGASRA